MQIITDSSTLYTIEQAREKGFEAVPLCISIKEKITVFNSKTLCGPHRYMTEMAQKMKKREEASRKY